MSLSTLEALPYLDETMYVRAPYFSGETRCRLRLFRGQGGGTVALVTEIAANKGPSITNAAEHVWSHLARQLDSVEFVMVEHYDAGSYPGTRRVTSEREETFDLVTVDHGRPSWKHLGFDGFRGLLG